jgi:hypothetical protein
MAEFQKACGFDVDIKEPKSVTPSQMSNDDLINFALANSPDKPITQALIEKFSKEGKFVSIRTIKERFGTLSEFQRQCGFEVVSAEKNDELYELSNDEIVELAQTLSPDKKLASKGIDHLSAEGKFLSRKTIRKRFGSLEAFYEACGF